MSWGYITPTLAIPFSEVKGITDFHSDIIIHKTRESKRELPFINDELTSPKISYKN